MSIETTKNEGYISDQQKAINEILLSDNMRLVTGVRTTIGDDCYDLSLDNKDILTVHVSEGQSTVKGFQFFVCNLLWVARCTRPKNSLFVYKATGQIHPPAVRN